MYAIAFLAALAAIKTGEFFFTADLIDGSKSVRKWANRFEEGQQQAQFMSAVTIAFI